MESETLQTGNTLIRLIHLRTSSAIPLKFSEREEDSSHSGEWKQLRGRDGKK